MSIELYEDDWEVDFGELEIRLLRRRGLISRIYRWRRKYPLSSFHKFAHKVQASSEGIAFSAIFNPDAMPPIKGVPKKLELVNGWSIPPESLARMIGDGYVLLGYGELLVPQHSSRFWTALNLKPGIFGFGIDLKKLLKR